MHNRLPGIGGRELAAGSVLAASEKPNIVLFLGDNLSWVDFDCYGSKAHKTPQNAVMPAPNPNVDRARAAQGTRWKWMACQGTADETRIR